MSAAPFYWSKSLDWAAGKDERGQITGLLVANLGTGQYGLWERGRWNAYSVADWRRKFSTPWPWNLQDGAWGVMDDVLRYQDGHVSYGECFDKHSLQRALNFGPNQLVVVGSVKTRNERTLYHGASEGLNIPI